MKLNKIIDVYKNSNQQEQRTIESRYFVVGIKQESQTTEESQLQNTA